jgi:hypothetical protein
LAFHETNIGFANVVTATDGLAETLGLALDVHHGNTLDFDFEHQLKTASGSSAIPRGCPASASDGARRVRGRVTQQMLGHVARQFDQIGIEFKIGVTQERHTGLAAADELAGAAQMQILAGNLKTVGILDR